MSEFQDRKPRDVLSRYPSRTGKGLLAAACAVFLATSIGAPSGEEPAGDGPPETPLVPLPVPLGAGVYLLGALDPAAAYAVSTSAGIVLVDCGLESDAGPLKTQMDHLGLDWRRVCAILLTHAHWDHCGGAEHLRSATGAKVHAGKADAAVLRQGGPREALYSAFDLPPRARFHPTTVDVPLTGGEVLAFGDVRIQVLATPGHTPGSVCYLLERDGLRIVFGGDVISMLQGDETSPARTARPLGTYSAYFPEGYRGDARAYLGSLRRLRALPAPDLVLPGHPRGDPTPQSPRLPRERWESLLDQGIAEMASLAARYEADGKDFLDGQARELLPGLFSLGDFHGHAVYAFHAAGQLVLVDAPGGPGLLGFVKSRLQALGQGVLDPSIVLLTSCDETATAGLSRLARECRCQVVAPPGCLRQVRECCPPGHPVQEAGWLRTQRELKIEMIPLHGGRAECAGYRLNLDGKVVLFTGRFLADPESIPPAPAITRTAPLPQGAVDFLASVFRLAQPVPNLWLPARPVHGRNANLYGREWQDILDANYRAGSRTSSTSARPENEGAVTAPVPDG